MVNIFFFSIRYAMSEKKLFERSLFAQEKSLSFVPVLQNFLSVLIFYRTEFCFKRFGLRFLSKRSFFLIVFNVTGPNANSIKFLVFQPRTRSADYFDTHNNIIMRTRWRNTVICGHCDYTICTLLPREIFTCLNNLNGFRLKLLTFNVGI